VRTLFFVPQGPRCAGHGGSADLGKESRMKLANATNHPGPTQDDQINCLSILIIFMKQRTYLITLPNRFKLKRSITTIRMSIDTRRLYQFFASWGGCLT
jgi:hypothetical protein